MAEIKGIKMNGEVLTTFNTTGGGHTYVVEIAGSSEAHLTIKSDKDIALGTRVSINDFLETFNVLEFERIPAVGNYVFNSKNHYLLYAYISGSKLNVFYNNVWDESDVENIEFIVSGKR